MAGTILINIDVPPVAAAANLKKRKNNPKEKILPRKKVRIVGKDGKKCLPSFDQFNRLVDSIGEEQIASVQNTSSMVKIGLAVMKFGINSNQVKQAQAKAKKENLESTVQFLGCLHKIYRKQLEKYKDILDLQVCCICLSCKDDINIRKDFNIRKALAEEEEEEEDPAKHQFVKLSEMPAGSSYPRGLKCNCKNTSICMSCFFKLIRVGQNPGYVRAQCPTCRVIFCFNVGVLPKGDDHLVMISGIKSSSSSSSSIVSRCPFRIPRLEESESDSESENESEQSHSPCVPISQSPPPLNRPETPTYSPRDVYSPPRSSYNGPQSPPRSSYNGAQSPPATPPRVRSLRPSTMSLRKRGAARAKKRHFNPFANASSSDSDSDSNSFSTTAQYKEFLKYSNVPCLSKADMKPQWSEAGNLIVEDKDFILPKKSASDEKEEKPEVGTNGYNHYLQQMAKLSQG